MQISIDDLKKEYADLIIDAKLIAARMRQIEDVLIKSRNTINNIKQENESKKNNKVKSAVK